MSALARYYMSQGAVVAGYDRTATDLTRALEAEGALVHYADDVRQIPYTCRLKEQTLVVYTPAIPATHSELRWFQERGFTIVKRAEVLGKITAASKGLCVAGTHGKTTTSTMCAHILHQSALDCNAFLGGIAKNYNSNYILAPQSDYAVIEADEYDRSFHHLQPFISVVTATDADHLDIYGTEEAYLEAFRIYASRIAPDGRLIVNTQCSNLIAHCQREQLPLSTYGRTAGDYHAENIRVGNGKIVFDFVSPTESVADVELGQPLLVNIDNAVAAMAMAQLAGCNAEELRYGVQTFRGVDRRFDIKLNTAERALMSDYAHHPKEIARSLESIRQLYDGRRITVVFQPHLYTRTRDFYEEFAEALSLADEVVLCEIYPAREEPIDGISSEIIFERLAPQVEKQLIDSREVSAWAKSHAWDVLVLLGAGDIENSAEEILEEIRRLGNT